MTTAKLFTIRFVSNHKFKLTHNSHRLYRITAAKAGGSAKVSDRSVKAASRSYRSILRSWGAETGEPVEEFSIQVIGPGTTGPSANPCDKI